MLKLRDYQIDAIKNMKNGCILNGGVGSGKSLTSLSYYYMTYGGTMEFLRGGRYKKMKQPANLIIITTARKRDTLEWDRELAPFLLSTHKELNGYKNKVTIDSWNNIKKYKDITNSFFIFDEQRLVGSGEWVKSFLKIAKHNKWILLSATPGDTWSDYIPVFLANKFYRNKSEFLDEHAVFKRYSKFPQIEKWIGTKKLERLRRSILIDMDFDRPTVQYHNDILVNYDKEEYKKIMTERWDIWKDEPILNASGLCYALRKSVNSHESRQNELLKVANKHDRIIIFYNFNYELDILKGLDWGDDVDVAEWNGKRHDPTPNSDKWVYFVQYTAGAEGWNCITTNAMVFFSQNYSYKIMQQSAGRIDRMNTTYMELYYYHFKTTSKIDLAISRALRNKKKFNENGFVKI